MSAEEKYSLEEAHLKFAKMLNGETWDYLDKKDRSSDDIERMIHTAHASLYHWLKIGSGVNHQRGEYMLARVYTAAGLGEEALRHANRCIQLGQEHAEELEDFDWAFAYECLARAHARAGNAEDVQIFLEKARQAGEKIQDPEDKKIFESELSGGDWFGVQLDD